MKRWIVLVLASLILLSLCSCAEPAEESNAGVSSATQDESAPENEPAQQSSADSETGVLSHSTISETWDSGVVVDADVTALKRKHFRPIPESFAYSQSMNWQRLSGFQ